MENFSGWTTAGEHAAREWLAEAKVAAGIENNEVLSTRAKLSPSYVCLLLRRPSLLARPRARQSRARLAAALGVEESALRAKAEEAAA